MVPEIRGRLSLSTTSVFILESRAIMNRPPPFALRSLDRFLLQAARIPFCTLTFRPVYAISKICCTFSSAVISAPFPLVHLFAGAPKAGFLLQFVSGFEQKFPDLLFQINVFRTTCLSLSCSQGLPWNGVSLFFYCTTNLRSSASLKLHPGQIFQYRVLWFFTHG